ncbi:hypothetical protein K9O30_10360 [Clostridium bowmanii]|uniref:hypothetical protein n=1 Tax=Clostridium bowmanii TaxID=132925 RepID=UPI001CD4B4B3|nr:hypothetical protein [Clostridium bowmanii]MCA1074115.1 hypothetical protein [Clostridium bowmanii]
MSGKKYLDFHGNSIHQVGYKNSYVIKAVKNQMEDLPFIPRRYTSDIVARAAAKLVNKTTSKDFKGLFTPSGTAAVGIEFVKNRDSKEKHEELAEKVLYKSLELGLSFKVSSGKCITWHPPLIVSINDIDIAFNIFEKAIVFSLNI